MSKGLLGTMKLGAIIGVIILAAIAILYATGVFGSADAKDAAVKTMWIVGIFTAATVVITIVAGGGSRPAEPPAGGPPK